MSIINLLGPVFVSVCFGGAFFLAGAILLFFTIRTQKKSTASMSWLSTPGTIFSATVRQNYSSDEDGHTQYTYSPMVEYDYSVNGQAYRGKIIHYGITASPSQATAQKEASRFSPGMPVTVFYNPENPEQAVLEQKVVKSRVGLILGIVFLALTLCTCLISAVLLIQTLVKIS